MPTNPTNPSFRKTLLALRSVALCRGHDAVGEDVAGDSAAKVEALRSAVDSWLAQLMGTLLARIMRTHDARRTSRTVSRSAASLLSKAPTGASSAGRAELAEIGGLLSTSLDASDVRGARRAVVAAQAWWETY